MKPAEAMPVTRLTRVLPGVEEALHDGPADGDGRRGGVRDEVDDGLADAGRSGGDPAHESAPAATVASSTWPQGVAELAAASDDLAEQVSRGGSRG